jgi:6-phospho-beta-glucosidase
VKLTILGGGGFRVPLVFSALLEDVNACGITEIWLYDVNRARVEVIAAVLQQAAHSAERSVPRVVVADSLYEALVEADFVFSAIRVGGVYGRTVDERVAMEAGLLGQETVGAGGIAFGLRTVPEVVRLAERIAELAPAAWVVNFTNPAGLVTEAMQTILGARVIGICDSPSGLCRRAALAVGADPDTARFDYAGLNHLGWLRALEVEGVDRLPGLLADDEALQTFTEGRLFGPAWLRALESIPNEYLHYYYFQREAIASAADAGATRGEFLQSQQDGFYLAASRDPSAAFEDWQRVRAERDASYMAETRTEADERDDADLAAGGYEVVALGLMRALAGGPPATLILNVANGETFGCLDPRAVIEVPCEVDADGPSPLRVAPLSDDQAGLMCSVKAVERSVIEAATTGSRVAAVRAFALHPLVDSVVVAEHLLDAYVARLPELAYLG